MGFDLDRSESQSEPAPAGNSVFSRALSRNLMAERFAIDAYRKIAEGGQNYDKATLRLVKVALAVEEEHAEILSAIIENLRHLNGAFVG
jgi:bacterioferritin (cytochrome b1)